MNLEKQTLKFIQYDIKIHILRKQIFLFSSLNFPADKAKLSTNNRHSNVLFDLDIGCIRNWKEEQILFPGHNKV